MKIKIKSILNNIKNKIYKIKDKVINDKDYRLKFILIVGVSFIVLLALISTFTKKKIEQVTINDIETMIKNKDRAIIYYYSSKSTNKYNESTKRYLDSKNINYYIYDDYKINKEEYNKLLKLLNIDKDVFGTPAIIYIYQGKMFANIINIDSKEVVDKFIYSYDLYTVK